MSNTIRQGSEAEIKASILLRIGGRRDVVCWNHPTGTARALQPPFPVIKYGKIGSSDIIGTIGPWGLFFGIECKTLKGYARETQTAFEKAIKKRGGIYIIGRNPDDAEFDLLVARLRWAEMWGLERFINYDNLEVIV